MGRGYVIEHCVSTLNSIRQEENYRIYLTEVLRTIAKGVGYNIKYSYSDMLNDSKQSSIVEEEKTPDEIISRIKSKAELINNGLTESGSEDNA